MRKFTWFPSHVIKNESLFSNVPSVLLKIFNLKLFIFPLFSAPFCTLSIIVKMSFQDKSATNENKFVPKGQHYVKLSEMKRNGFEIAFFVFSYSKKWE